MNSLEQTQTPAAPAIPDWIKYSLIHPAASYLLIAIGIFAPGIVAYFLMLLVVMANLPGEFFSVSLLMHYGVYFPFTESGLWSQVVLMVPMTWLLVIFPLFWIIQIFKRSHS